VHPGPGQGRTTSDMTGDASVALPIESATLGSGAIRPDEEQPAEEDEAVYAAAPAEAPETKQEGPPLFFWFFFPLPGARVAWEATTGSGRATYFFDAARPVDQAVAVGGDVPGLDAGPGMRQCRVQVRVGHTGQGGGIRGAGERQDRQQEQAG